MANNGQFFFAAKVRNFVKTPQNSNNTLVLSKNQFQPCINDRTTYHF